MCIIFTHQLFAQYGNEWINYSQSYYKIKVYKTGIHKLDYSVLENAGIPLQAVSKDYFQLFAKEKEIPIHIEDGGDNSFDPGDYILFYGEKNDGWLDSALYSNPATIGNPSYSLYNDTLLYFFTWNNQVNGLRFAVENDINYTSYNESPYWIQKVENSLNNWYIECRDNNNVSSSSFFMPGEGWASDQANGISGYTFNFSLNTASPYTGAGAPDARFNGISVSNSNAWNNVNPGQYNHDFSWIIGSTTIHTEKFNGYQQKNIQKEISASLLVNGTTPLKYQINASTEYATDIQAVSYYSLEYPKLPTFSGATKNTFFVANASSQSKINLRITNATLSNPVAFAFGGGVAKKFAVTSAGSNVWQLLVSNSANNRMQKLVIESSQDFIDVSLVEPVTSTAKFTDYNLYQNDTNVVIMILHPKLKNASEAYAAYRRSPSGGSYNVILAEVNELYMQFGGGIEKHIFGIRRFALKVYDAAVVQKPKGLYLLGKGIREASESYTGLVVGARKNASVFHKSLIPSFGYPASDVLITADIVNLSWEPRIPTGRIAAATDEQLAGYLAKIVQYEEAQDPLFQEYNAENKDWQKQILHFAGGSNAAEQFEFQSYLNGMKTGIEGAEYAGHVTTYKKTSSNPLDPVLLADVSERIAKGVSIMNFFGHSSADGFDINVDDPSNWNNQKRYPLVIGNGCYSGDIYQDYYSTAEHFVLTPQEGAIGFLSSVRTGFAFALNYYTSELYSQFSSAGYGRKIGDQIITTIGRVRQQYGNNIYTETTCTQMALHGDPLIRINTHERAEIDINESSVYYVPQNIDMTTDSIEVNVILKNVGKAIQDTFKLDIRRTFPDNSDSLYSVRIPFLNYCDTVRVKIPAYATTSLGLNNLSIEADIPTEIPEFEEITNNIVRKNLLINFEGIVPVFPYDFAVVPIDSVSVKASTVNSLAPHRNYIFELDTTDLFNSPFRRYAKVSGSGGVKEVDPSQWKLKSTNTPAKLICTDSTVYFWRVGIDSSVPDWREHSFQYIRTKEGWGQAHFFQYKKNSFSSLRYDRTVRLKQFDTVPQPLSVDVYNEPTELTQYGATLYKINNQQQEYGACTPAPSLHVAVIDPVSLIPWGTAWNGQNPRHSFGNVNDGAACRNRVEKYFIFRQNSTQQLEAFRNMILDSVPDGHYVLIYTMVGPRYADWNTYLPSLSQTFQNLGATQIGQGTDKAFIFFYRKGDLSSVQEIVSSGQPGEKINLTTQIKGFSFIGEETTPLIGPAVKWESIFWKQHPREIPSADTTILTIHMKDWAGTEQALLHYEMTPNDSVIHLETLINAAQYPYLQLTARYKDSVTATPAALDRWHVLFQPVPEAAIDASDGITWLPGIDSLRQGQPLRFAVDVKNISNHPMDSLLISYWIEDANRVVHPLTYPRQDSLRVNQVLRDTIEVNTVGLTGLNRFWMEVNPYIAGTNRTDQLEKYHFNNLLEKSFYVSRDEVNPILDVTFDGYHILNGDIVSPKSEIVISLKDENPFLLMNEIADTSLFGVYLTDPQGIQKRIPFIDAQGNMIMQWIPADAQSKRFKIIYSGQFDRDGKYTLFVQGADKSGNLSGDIQYRIQFEVIRESSITYMMNYPNPFSTSTRFVFTLTGSDVPDEMIIQIMTVTGKVVREITEDEIGPLKIGRNISQYAWDGRDEFGDYLANGVYLYRVLTKIKGEDIKHRNSGADQYFKKEFGKMYLMR